MARIRTIKPEFFRHEQLQDLESDHPAKHPMLVFAGLFTQCDKLGVFPFNPRQLKLDICPFLDFDMAETLQILVIAGQIEAFESGGKTFGYIPTFTKHQRITGKEAEADSKYPYPPTDRDRSTWEAPGKHPGKVKETPVKSPGARERKGKGKEEEEEGRGVSAPTILHGSDASFSELEIAVSSWNNLAKECGLATVQKLTDARKSKLRARLKDCGGIDGWQAALKKVRGSPGLLGRASGDWKASFDFVLQECSFTKLMEGTYDGWTGKSGNETGSIVETTRRALEKQSWVGEFGGVKF